MSEIVNNSSIYNSLLLDRKEHKNNTKVPENVNLKKPESLFNTTDKTKIDNKSGNSKTLVNIFSDNKIENKSIDKPADIKGKVMGVAKGTGYYPYNNAMEGGHYDKRGKKLTTLQDFLNGKASYVSIALDKNLYKKGVIKYGDKFRIPELEAKYGRKIEFRAVDTGGAFTNKNFNRVDICTGSKTHSLDKTVNGKLTLIKVDN